MELRHFRYFQAAAEELSFSRAAKRLHIAQPALSRAIKQLEHSLGAEVLERTRHFVRLTPAGAVLLREIAVPTDHRLARRRTVPWTTLAREPLIVLARREGMGLHDAVIAGCRQAGVTPRLAHTPSLIGTVMSYVEAGAGLGVVTESVVTP